MYPKPVSSLTLPIIFMLTLSTSFADENKTYVVSGIDDVTEIVVDEFGVPHIYAENHYDVFFAQGFNAARDRLWQIDLWKRRGLSQLSDVSLCSSSAAAIVINLKRSSSSTCYWMCKARHYGGPRQWKCPLLSSKY